MEEPVGLESHDLQRPLADFCLRQLPLTTLAGLRLVSKAICELVDHETGHIWLEAAGSLTFINPSCLPEAEDGTAVQSLLRRQGRAIRLMSGHPAKGEEIKTSTLSLRPRKWSMEGGLQQGTQDQTLIRWAPCPSPGVRDPWFLAASVAVNASLDVVRTFGPAAPHDQGICWTSWCHDGCHVAAIANHMSSTGQPSSSLQLSVTNVVTGALAAGPMECLSGHVLGDSNAFVVKQCAQRMAPSLDAILVLQSSSVLVILELPFLTEICQIVSPPHMRHGHHICAAAWAKGGRIVVLWTAEGASLALMVHESTTGRPERMFSLQSAGHPGRTFEFLDLVMSPTQPALAMRWQMSHSPEPGSADGDDHSTALATALVTFSSGNAAPAMLYRSMRCSNHADDVCWCMWAPSGVFWAAFDPSPSNGPFDIHPRPSFLSIFQLPSAHVVYEQTEVWEGTFSWSRDGDQCTFGKGQYTPSRERTINLRTSAESDSWGPIMLNRGGRLSGSSRTSWGQRLPDEGRPANNRGALVRWHPSGRFYAEVGLHDYIDCKSSFRVTDAASFSNTIDWTAQQLAGQLQRSGQEMYCRLLDFQWSPDGTELAVAMATGFVHLTF